MLKAAKDMKRSPRIIFAGTATQFGFTDTDKIVTEKTASVPITYYDVNKCNIEQALRAYHIQCGLPVATLRLANVYGPSVAGTGWSRGIIHNFARSVIANKRVRIDHKLCYKFRDFVFIEDVINAFLVVGAGNWDYLDGSGYVVGSGKSYTFNQVFGILGDITGKPVKTEFIDVSSRTPIDYRSFYCNPTLMKKRFGWEAKVLLSEGLKKTVEYYEKQ